MEIQEPEQEIDLGTGPLLKKILDLLPFNGSKLGLGTIFALYSLLSQFMTLDDIMQLVQALLVPHLTATAIVLIVVGWIHKVLKNKYPNTN